MRPRPRLVAAVALATALLLALSMYLHSWGGPALLAVLAAGYAWYRVQVARGEAAQKFFGEAGEDTRLTGLQGASPSEMPADRAPAPPPRA